MTPQQIAIVQRSFKELAPSMYDITDAFYSKLFKAMPSTRAMFPENMFEQRRKLVETLTYTVNGLSYPDALMPVVHDLGRRHKGYRVRPEHYGHVAKALVDAIQEAVGPKFAGSQRAAWEACLAALAGEMIGAAKAA